MATNKEWNTFYSGLDDETRRRWDQRQEQWKEECCAIYEGAENAMEPRHCDMVHLVSMLASGKHTEDLLDAAIKSHLAQGFTLEQVHSIACCACGAGGCHASFAYSASLRRLGLHPKPVDTSSRSSFEGYPNVGQCSTSGQAACTDHIAMSAFAQSDCPSIDPKTATFMCFTASLASGCHYCLPDDIAFARDAGVSDDEMRAAACHVASIVGCKATYMYRQAVRRLSRRDKDRRRR